VGVGDSFDAPAGVVRRAPPMQHLSHEWLHPIFTRGAARLPESRRDTVVSQRPRRKTEPCP